MCGTGKHDKMIRTCLEGANGFYEVAKSLNPLTQMSAFFVNSSFCCELYLKALLMKTRADGTYKKTHSLLELFNQLPQQERVEVQQQFQSTSITLIDFLKDEQNAFENWRYEFEEKELHGNIAGFEKLTDTLNAYVNSKC